MTRERSIPVLEGLSLDPFTILGISRGASAEEIREAFHQKSKKHHPDLGGDDWAFRVVVRAYEILNQLAAETIRIPARDAAPDTGRVRPGVHDKNVDPAHLVHIEILWMRYDVEDYLQMLGQKSDADRNLSGTLTITWPDPAMADRAEQIPEAGRILKDLSSAFEEAKGRPGVRGGHSHVEKGCFEAWLSYADGRVAWVAFKNLHTDLKARGLGAKQWTRDMTVPRR